MDRQWRNDLNDNFRELAGFTTTATNALNKANTADQKANSALLQSTSAEQNADFAKQLAQEAKTTANNANDTSNSVQKQLDQIVIEGDSSLAANQARLDANDKEYGSLKARIDAEQVKTEEMFLNPLQFKAPGAVDDTAAFRAAVQYAINRRVRKLVFPYSTYKLSKPIYLNGVSDFELDLQNSTIIWDGRDVVTTDRNIRYYGVFTAMPEDGGFPKEQVVSWQKEILDTNNIIKETNFTGNTLKCSKITVNNMTSIINNGDYVRFKVGEALTSGNEDYKNVFKPTVDILCKVLYVVGNDIYVDYYSPYDFSQVNIATVSTVQKVNVIRNIKIMNALINDISPYKAPDGNLGDNPNRSRLVSGFGFYNAVNCNVENVRGRGMKLPLLMVKSSYGFEAKNVLNEYPESHGGGEGYAIHFEFCMKCHAFDVQGNDGNSVIDFSGSAFCSATRVKSTNTYSYKTIGTHGEAEHDIIFRDCEGAFGFSNSTQWFACMSINITLENCKGIITGQEDSYIDLLVKGGEFVFKSNKKNYFRRLIFENTKVVFGYQTEMLGHQRGINTPSTIKFNGDSKILCEDETAGLITRVKFKGLDVLELNGDIDFTGYTGKLSLENIKNININANIINAPLVLFNREKVIDKVNLNIKPKVIIMDNQSMIDRFLELDYLSDGNIFVNINGGIVNHMKDSDCDFFKFNNDTNKSNVNIFINTVGVTFYSKYSNRLKVSCLDESFPAKNYVKKQTAVGNTLVGATAVLDGWDFTMNKDISKQPSKSTGFMETTENASGSITAYQKGILALSQYNRAYLSYGRSNQYQWLELSFILTGSSSERPTNAKDGTMFFDLNLGKPIFKHGSSWKLADGAIV
ncbi:hypothetical protein [Bacillus toyonensis]|uniref:hypothetical protein n=1 Tax=Bacillus toyonensis TaxID=155322 RepID=UPI0015965224|nr:hypothetical protein [Bacillus toyonensis]